MLKVIAINGNGFEFDADSWSSNGSGLLIFKAGKTVAEFSSYLSVQAIADPVVPEEEEPPVEPETPAEEPELEPEPVEPEEGESNEPES